MLPCGALPNRARVTEISPDKNVNFRPAIAAFTVWAEPKGFAVLCPLTPPTRPEMRFLSIDPWHCTLASFPRNLTITQLPFS